MWEVSLNWTARECCNSDTIKKLIQHTAFGMSTASCICSADSMFKS